MNDAVLPDDNSGKNCDIGADVHSAMDFDRGGELGVEVALSASFRFQRMVRRVDVYVGTNLNIIMNLDLSTIQENSSGMNTNVVP